MPRSPTIVSHAVRQGCDEGTAVGGEDRLADLGIGGIRPSVPDVLHDRAMKQRNVLRHDGNGRAQALLGHPRNVLAAEQDAAGLNVVEALQEERRGRLAATRRTDQAHALTRIDPQTEVGEHPSAVRIAERDVLECDRAARLYQRLGFG